MRETIQIQNVNSDEFANQIITGVVEQITHLIQVPITVPKPDRLLTREEVSNYLSISLVSLWALTRDKVIPAYKIGKSVRYKESEVLQALEKTSNSNLK